MVAKSIVAGGSLALDTTDLGFMYNGSFDDPDGYHWELFSMDSNETSRPCYMSILT